MTIVMEELRALFNHVCEVRNSTSPASVLQLKDHLVSKKNIFINLLDNAPKNAQHRTTLQSGKATVEGTEYRLNDDFTKQAMFLSDQLDLDEFEAARLLLSGISSASTMNSSALDASVYLYHEERNYVLTILNVILENVKDETVEPAIRTVYTQFMADLIEEQGSYVSKILNSVKGLSVMISSLSKTGQLKSVNPAQPQQAQPQQAQSQMFQQPQQPIEEPIKFGSDTTALRIDRLTDERIYLAQVLYHICSLYWIAEPELMALLTYVQSISLSNATCSYVLIALMSALSTTRQKQLSANSFIGKNDYVTKLHESIMTKAYKVSTLKASVQIQWSLSIADMNKLGHTVTMNKTTIAEEAIKSDAFGFMNDYLLYFKQNKLDKIKKDTVQDMDLDDSTMAIDGLIVDPNDYHKFEAEICLDFQKFVVQELENTTRSFILNMSDFFRGLERVTTDELSAQEEDDKPLEQFLILLGSIYRNRLNAGLEFWQTSSALSTFVSWLLDYKFLNSLAGYFDFLAAIATGEQCAPLAHAMMKIGINTTDIYNSHLFSWGKLFGALQFYTKQYRERAAEDEPPTMAVHEEEPLCKFLNFCQQVIQYSDKARIAIWNEPVLDTHNSIVGLIGCPTSTRLRAALYNLLGAFCTNWGGGINQYGQKISFMVWNTLEHSDMVIPNKVMVQQAPSKAAITVPKPSITPANALFDNTFDNAATVSQRLQAQSVITQPVTAKPPKRNLTQFLPEQPAGFLREFEDEKSRRVYPETLAFLKLMASLIHTESKRDELISGFAPPKSSIPYCLGKDNHRSPGTAPYISLIVDHIFLNLKNQYYQYPENRWQLTDACLQVIENSIVSFDIEPIVDYVHCQNQKEPVTVVSFIEALDGNAAYNNAGIQDSEDLQQALLACVTHPGFDIVIRILSGGALIHELFKIVEMGRNAVTEKCKTKAGRNIDFKMCMTRCLRIFNKVFQLQNAFVNIFMPQLRATAKALPMGKYKLGPYEFPVPPPSLSSLGKHMLYNNEVIVQMALLINCEDEQDICRLSTSVLTWLTSEPEEYKLHVKFPDHINVPMGGIGSQIAGILISSHSAGEIILGFGERVHIDSAEITTYDDYEYDINVIPFWLAENTLNDVYRYKDDDPSRFASSVRVAILEMLLKTVEKDLPSPTMAEFLLGFNTSKDLEIKGFQYQAVSTDKRSRLACLYAILDLVHTGASDAEDQQETSVIVSHPVLAEKCYQLIYKLCARKSTSATMLQHLRNDGDFLTKQFTLIASRLENKLAVSQPHFEGLLVSADHARVRTDYLTMVSVLHQRAWMLQLIALELHQNRGSSTLLNLLYGGGSTKDIDVAEQLKGLSLELQGSYQQPLWNMVEILNSLDFTWIDGLDDGQEHKAPPTTSSTFKNFDAKRYIIKKDSYELYDIRAIFKVLRQYETNDVHTKTLSDQDRHALEFEMGNLLKQYMAENRHREISYGRLHCLRAWKQVVEITLSDCFDASFTFEYRERIIYDLLAVLLPKLHEDNALQSDMLKGLSEVILSLLTRLREDKRRQAVLKVGDSSVDVYELPADKLRNIFYLIVKSISKEKSTIEVRNTLYSSLVNVLQYITPDRSSHIIQLIREDHKLLGIICRDASFGREEFKATAFTVLESIYVLMGPQSTAAMHDCFAKDDFLKHTINMIKLSDDNLVTIIEKRDVSLLRMNVHEATFSFFMQIALNREGASLLLKNGLMHNLSGCKFINTRLEDDTHMNGFRLKDNPDAPERHRRLLTPVLELVNVILKSLTGIQGAEKLQIETWVKDQVVILSILKGDSTTLSSLYILQLVTMLMYQLSCQNGFFEGLDKRGLDVIDAALMNLIPKYCQWRNWTSSIVPTNDKEKAWIKEKVPETVNNSEPRTAFTVKVDKHIAEIKNNLLGYAQNSTFRSHKLIQTESFQPIFANILRKDSTRSPSLTTLSSCLSSTGKQLTMIIAEFNSLCAQKENVASLKYEEIQEIAHTAIPKELGIKFDSLNPMQQTQVLIAEIDLRREQKMKELRSLVYTIENAIFILWRHLEFYLSRDSISKSTTFSPCERYANEKVVLLQQSLFQTSPVVIQQLKEACQHTMEPILQKLESIILPSSSLQDTALSVLYKRLRKCYQS